MVSLSVYIAASVGENFSSAMVASLFIGCSSFVHGLFVGSLGVRGFLLDGGSLTHDGFLELVGSLHFGGFLLPNGSLSISGFLMVYGSLIAIGFLLNLGSLHFGGFLW